MNHWTVLSFFLLHLRLGLSLALEGRIEASSLVRRAQSLSEAEVKKSPYVQLRVENVFTSIPSACLFQESHVRPFIAVHRSAESGEIVSVAYQTEVPCVPLIRGNNKLDLLSALPIVQTESAQGPTPRSRPAPPTSSPSSSSRGVGGAAATAQGKVAPLKEDLGDLAQGDAPQPKEEQSFFRKNLVLIICLAVIVGNILTKAQEPERAPAGGSGSAATVVGGRPKAGPVSAKKTAQ